MKLSNLKFNLPLALVGVATFAFSLIYLKQIFSGTAESISFASVLVPLPTCYLIGKHFENKVRDRHDEKNHAKYKELCQERFRDLSHDELEALKEIVKDALQIMPEIADDPKLKNLKANLKILLSELNEGKIADVDNFLAVKHSDCLACINCFFAKSDVPIVSNLHIKLSELSPNKVKIKPVQFLLETGVSFYSSVLLMLLPTISINVAGLKWHNSIKEKQKQDKQEEVQKVEESAFNPPSWINYRKNWQEAVINKEPLLAAVIKR